MTENINLKVILITMKKAIHLFMIIKLDNKTLSLVSINDIIILEVGIMSSDIQKNK